MFCFMFVVCFVVGVGFAQHPNCLLRQFSLTYWNAELPGEFPDKALGPINGFTHTTGKFFHLRIIYATPSRAKTTSARIRHPLFSTSISPHVSLQ
jgi:hypothetical protein